MDSQTMNQIILCLGIMNAVAGANNAIKAMAKALAVGVEKKLVNAALTKGVIYPFVKQVAKWFGVKLTKTIFAESVGHAVPIVGGVVAGGITFLSFKPCCYRLKNALMDTKLSNPDHKESEEEKKIFNDIVDAEVVDINVEDDHDDLDK